MRNILVLVFASLVILLGYSIYLDSKVKKREQVSKVINDAEHSLKALEANPNYNQRSSLYRVHHQDIIQ
ncbi:hypothetical protein IAE19_05215 [Acinetobacter sp. S40]|uniref:hypothetical protein n=1 Tax=unclassified Acinetobacter TaxID=196816 RepID=UPI001909DFDA|nr:MULTISPECIES: hypothetical protein [unclassified Acinetobacter]MBJ9984841.1 hypothetical protein [Acinetobacter sp. S40]MBK0063168.1 hypothetical protein [Acinetobacter sp. S55]MBK0066414.1 hypothetical protein [Acinetobacter sp. S54]